MPLLITIFTHTHTRKLRTLFYCSLNKYFPLSALTAYNSSFASSTASVFTKHAA